MPHTLRVAVLVRAPLPASARVVTERSEGTHTPHKMVSRVGRLVVAPVHSVRTPLLSFVRATVDRMVLVTEVFVPGGLPEVTYVARDALQLERQVNDFLAEPTGFCPSPDRLNRGRRCFSRRAIPNAVRLSGGDIRNANEFWSALGDHLGAYTEVTKRFVTIRQVLSRWVAR